MSAALDYTPAVCVPMPDGAPQVVQRPQLRAVTQSDPARTPQPVIVPDPRRAAEVTVLHAPRDAERAAPVRLTRRGVAVLSALVAAVGGALLWFAALSASGAPDASPPGAAHGARVTVRSGDTLWSVATTVAPGVDPRAEVAALQKANRLRSAQLTPGQTLRVP